MLRTVTVLAFNESDHKLPTSKLVFRFEDVLAEVLRKHLLDVEHKFRRVRSINLKSCKHGANLWLDHAMSLLRPYFIELLKAEVSLIFAMRQC